MIASILWKIIGTCALLVGFCALLDHDGEAADWVKITGGASILTAMGCGLLLIWAAA